MRQWINLFEQWHNTFTTPEGPVDVFANPSPNEIKKLIAQITREHGPLDLPLRASIGPDGTLYVWNAWLATHSDIISAHNLPTVGGYLYLAPDHILLNDLNWEYDEDSDDPEKPYGGWVRHYYEATKNNVALQRIYGAGMKIIGRDDEKPVTDSGTFVVDDEFIAKHVQ